MPTRKFTFSTEEEFTRFVKEDLLYPCVLSMSFPRTEQEMKDPYFRNKGETRSISFEQWEGSWGHQSEKYILLARDIYSPLGVVMGRLGKGVALFEITVIEFDREEYVKFVTGRR